MLGSVKGEGYKITRIGITKDSVKLLVVLFHIRRTREKPSRSKFFNNSSLYSSAFKAKLGQDT